MDGNNGAHQAEIDRLGHEWVNLQEKRERSVAHLARLCDMATGGCAARYALR